ncbi:MAG: DUF72 domain-containing protein [Verrucomicrobiota bacterium]
MPTPSLGYYLGGHAWSVKEWVGSFFPKGTSASQYLTSYSQRVNAVEGNSTFYGLPKMDLIHRWMDQAEEGFLFCFKFPQRITHHNQLEHCRSDLESFLEILSVAQSKTHLGPALLQMGPRFGAAQFSKLEAFINRLPSEFEYAVEVRHSDFFDNGANERNLHALLRDNHIDRAVFDTRALYAKPPSDESEAIAQKKKPKVPLCQTATGRHPMVRLVGRNVMADNGLWLKDWVPQVAHWIHQGKTPYIFVHTPDDRFFPEQALAFHEALRLKVNHLPKLPFSLEADSSSQLSLF